MDIYGMVCVDTMMIHVGLAEWNPVHIKHRRETMVDVGDRHYIWDHRRGVFSITLW